MAEDRERRDADAQQAGDDAVMGAPPGRDPDFDLHSEIGEEAKRLATSPRGEVRRLGDELEAGETEATPLIALSAVGIWATLVVALVIGLVVLAIYIS